MNVEVVELRRIEPVQPALDDPGPTHPNTNSNPNSEKEVTP